MFFGILSLLPLDVLVQSQMATPLWETFTLPEGLFQNKAVEEDGNKSISRLVEPRLLFLRAVCLSGFMHINACRLEGALREM